MHGRYMPLEVVLAVGEVAALRTAEQSLGAGRRGRGKPGGWSG